MGNWDDIAKDPRSWVLFKVLYDYMPGGMASPEGGPVLDVSEEDGRRVIRPGEGSALAHKGGGPGHLVWNPATGGLVVNRAPWRGILAVGKLGSGNSIITAGDWRNLHPGMNSGGKAVYDGAGTKTHYEKGYGSEDPDSLFDMLYGEYRGPKSYAHEIMLDRVMSIPAVANLVEGRDPKTGEKGSVAAKIARRVRDSLGGAPANWPDLMHFLSAVSSEYSRAAGAEEFSNPLEDEDGLLFNEMARAALQDAILPEAVATRGFGGDEEMIEAMREGLNRRRGPDDQLSRESMDDFIIDKLVDNIYRTALMAKRNLEAFRERRKGELAADEDKKLVYAGTDEGKVVDYDDALRKEQERIRKELGLVDSHINWALNRVKKAERAIEACGGLPAEGENVSSYSPLGFCMLKKGEWSLVVDEYRKEKAGLEARLDKKPMGKRERKKAQASLDERMEGTAKLYQIAGSAGDLYSDARMLSGNATRPLGGMGGKMFSSGVILGDEGLPLDMAIEMCKDYFRGRWGKGARGRARFHEVFGVDPDRIPSDEEIKDFHSSFSELREGAERQKRITEAVGRRY